MKRLIWKIAERMRKVKESYNKAAVQGGWIPFKSWAFGVTVGVFENDTSISQ